MTSELKSATARANGAKSKGPKTAATREKSSQNSTTHGATSRHTVILECENEAQFLEMVDAFYADYEPTTEPQKNLVAEMATTQWRIDRFCLIEAALLDDEMHRRSSLTEDPPPRDAGIKLSRAFRSLADDSNALALCRRYLSTLHRIYEKAYSTLRELQAAEPKSAAPPVEPTHQPEPESPHNQLIPLKPRPTTHSFRNEPSTIHPFLVTAQRFSSRWQSAAAVPPEPPPIPLPAIETQGPNSN